MAQCRVRARRVGTSAAPASICKEMRSTNFTLHTSLTADLTEYFAIKLRIQGS